MQNILILDNSDNVLEVLEIVLKKTGEFKVYTCNCVNSLFDNLQSLIPDLLILDVMHTQLTKEMICEDLRKRNALKNIPIIITSTQPAHINNYQDFGANDGLEKPFDLKKMKSKLNTLLNTSLN